jgi:hypothetical protein
MLEADRASHHLRAFVVDSVLFDRGLGQKLGFHVVPKRMVGGEVRMFDDAIHPVVDFARDIG